MWRDWSIGLLIGVCSGASPWTVVASQQYQDGIHPNSADVAVMPGTAVDAPAPDDERVEARFVAEVRWIEVIGKREASVVPIGVDPRWLVGIEIRSIEETAPYFDRVGDAVLAIHSPVRLFAQPREKVPGKSFSFRVTGRLSDGRPVYLHAQATETP
jgi:hypothetical protein